MAPAPSGMIASEMLRAMRQLPVGGLDDILGGTDPLVLAPHADDESLGCGGLLAACARAGRRPAILVLTDGAGSHPNSLSYPPARLRQMREREAREAACILGVKADRVTFMRLPDTATPTQGPAFEAAVEALAGELARQSCGTLLSPWRHDPHCDHLAAHLIAAEVARRTGVRLVSYPVWGWTLPDDAVLDGPAPAGWRLDVSQYAAVKQRAIASHRSQHGGLITDDPSGFALPASLLRHFAVPFETFLTSSHS